MKKDRGSGRISPSPGNSIDLMKADLSKLEIAGPSGINVVVARSRSLPTFESHGQFDEERDSVFVSSYVFQVAQSMEMKFNAQNRGDSFAVDVIAIKDGEGVASKGYGFLHLEFLRCDGVLTLRCTCDETGDSEFLEVSAACLKSIDEVAYDYVVSKARQVCKNVDWMLYRRDYRHLLEDYEGYKMYDVPKKWWLGPFLVVSGWLSFVLFDLKWLHGITLFGVAYWVSYEVMNRILGSKKRRLLEFVRGFR